MRRSWTARVWSERVQLALEATRRVHRSAVRSRVRVSGVESGRVPVHACVAGKRAERPLGARGRVRAAYERLRYRRKALTVCTIRSSAALGRLGRAARISSIRPSFLPGAPQFAPPWAAMSTQAISRASLATIRSSPASATLQKRPVSPRPRAVCRRNMHIAPPVLTFHGHLCGRVATTDISPAL